MVDSSSAIKKQQARGGSNMSDLPAKRANEDYSGDVAGAEKKQRIDVPSPVLHCRNVPIDCTEMELMQLGQPFGRVVNVLILKNSNSIGGKTQAFIELETAEVATQMLQCYAGSPPFIRKRPIYFSYSQHQHLTNPSLNMGGTGVSGTILLVKIINQIYPVTLDVLYQVFSKFGNIQKMITFTKSDGVFQSLVQYADSQSATQAKLMLDGQNLYSRCCTLKIEDSKLSQLSVKYNNDKSWDFTNPNLPAADGQPLAQAYAQQVGVTQVVAQPMAGVPGMPTMAVPAAPTVPGMVAVNQVGQMVMAAQMMGAAAPAGPGCVLLVNNLEPQYMGVDAIFNLVGLYADVIRVKILFNKKESALVQVSDPSQALVALQYLNGVHLYGKELHIALSKHNEVQMPRDNPDEQGKELTKDYSRSPAHRFRVPTSRNFQNIAPPGPVLHVSNLPAVETEETVKARFAQHGTVLGFRFI
eukprot:Ihof_evm2s104 gene=Ihof_evmTU2s104